MEMLLALLIQSAFAPDASAPGTPRLTYAAETTEDAPRPRVNQGRSFRTDLNALDQPLAREAEPERRPPVSQARPGRAAPGRTTR